MVEEQEPSSPPLVRIVIVNFNGSSVLSRCLAALAAQDMQDFEAVIVDNASTDGSSLLGLPDERFRWLNLPLNVGFAAGNNEGARGCRSAWLVTLNPDAYPRANWLSRLLAAVVRHPHATMFGSTQISANHPNIIDGNGDCFFAAGLPWRGGYGHSLKALPPEGEVFGPCAAAAAYRMDAFNEVQGFDERFFCYYEDVDLAFRMRLRGGHCIQVADAVVEHVGSAISGRRSPFVQFHSARNRLWLFVKNVPGPAFALLLPMHLAMTAALCVWAVFRGHGRAVLTGLAAAMKALPEVLEERRRVQQSRSASCWSILRIMIWWPLDVLQRRHGVRPRGFDASRL